MEQNITRIVFLKFINVHAMVQQAAMDLPSGYKLIIKEHTPNIGLKNDSFIKFNEVT